MREQYTVYIWMPIDGNNNTSKYTEIGKINLIAPYLQRSPNFFIFVPEQNSQPEKIRGRNTEKI